MHGQKAQTDACAHTTMVEACWACEDAEGRDGRTHDGGDGCSDAPTAMVEECARTT